MADAAPKTISIVSVVRNCIDGLSWIWPVRAMMPMINSGKYARKPAHAARLTPIMIW